MQDYPGEILRSTILGKTKWVQCPVCLSSGYENYNGEGEDVRPGISYDPDRSSGECENCGGLGFIESYT